MSKRSFADNDNDDDFFFPSRQRVSYSTSRPGRPNADTDGDPDIESMEYQDADGNVEETTDRVSQPQDPDEVDPLDAFMAEIQEEVTRGDAEQVTRQPKPRRDDLENDEEDHLESFLAARKNAGLSLVAEAMAAGYNSDEEVYATARAVDRGIADSGADEAEDGLDGRRQRPIEPLPPVDHSLMEYGEFERNLYEEHADVASMSDADVAVRRTNMGIRVSGFNVPKPIVKFAHGGFEPALLAAINKAGFSEPTPIQSQAIPAVLSGHDIIGIAKTGSGKTAAFLLPMVAHILDQWEIGKGQGPVGLILVPTRELALQIYHQAVKFCRPCSLKVSGVFGGMSKLEQFKELKAGCHVIVATPGRLIDMIKMKALSMDRTTYLVLDEADHMLHLGFEPQVRSIVGQIRPDRQTLLFSATMPRRVDRLAADLVGGLPVRITVGESGAANEDVTQVVHVLEEEGRKLPWLLENLPGRVDQGEVIVFVATKVRVEEVEAGIRGQGFRVQGLHGDKDQATRSEVLRSFREGSCHVLVATDVASRGLDLRSVATVVNYDCAKDLESHVHRVGRTGRAGDKTGLALTLLTAKDARMAGELARSLAASGQVVSNELMALAMKDGRFKAQQEGRTSKKGKGRNRGGKAGVGGRGQRGVDFGLGLGYSTGEPAVKPAGFPPPPPPPPLSRSQPGTVPGFIRPALTGGTPALANAGSGIVKTGLMAKFRNSFVPSKSAADVPKQTSAQTPAPTVTHGVTSGLGGMSPAQLAAASLAAVAQRHQTALSGFVNRVTGPWQAAAAAGLSQQQTSRSTESGTGRRSGWDHNNGRESGQPDNRDGGRDRGKDRRRRSGWDQ